MLRASVENVTLGNKSLSSTAPLTPSNLEGGIIHNDTATAGVENNIANY